MAVLQIVTVVVTYFFSNLPQRLSDHRNGFFSLQLFGAWLHGMPSRKGGPIEGRGVDSSNLQFASYATLPRNDRHPKTLLLKAAWVLI